MTAIAFACLFGGTACGGTATFWCLARPGRAAALDAVAAALDTASGVLLSLSGDRVPGAAATALGALFAVLAVVWFDRWRRRRRKRRSLRALGNKARARLAAVLAKMPKPGPALRPQGSPA